MDILFLTIGYIMGILVTFVFVHIGMKAGVLRIDHSDPLDEPYMFLEISKNVDFITNRRYVLLEVRREDFIPRK